MATSLTDAFVIKRYGRQINVESFDGYVAESRIFSNEQIAKMAMTALMDLAKKHLELAFVLACATKQGGAKK